MESFLDNLSRFAGGSSIKTKLGIVLGLVFIAFVASSLALVYHWWRYEGLRPRTILLWIIYLAVSFVLFGVSAYFLSLI